MLAVLGGSFDPPHLGHVLVPTFVLAAGMAERVLVCPCLVHPLGKALSPFEERLDWTRAAMEVHDERVIVSDIERRRARGPGTPSFTLDLLEAVAAEHPDERVRLVVGSDITASGQTDRWHRWPRIEARFDPIVVPRVGSSPAGSGALPDIDSTAIRGWVARASDPDARAALAATVPAGVLARLLPTRGTVWLVGRGHVASHLAPWLRGRGRRVVGVPGRGLDVVGALPAPDGIVIAVRDASIEAVAAALAVRPDLPRVPVLHTAGARVAREVLAPLAARGHAVGTLHPICSLRAELPRSALARASFGIEGDEAAVGWARELIGTQPALDLGGRSAAQRVAYHAACSLAANHLAVLERAAAAVLTGQRVPAAVADRALAVLMRSALDNVAALGVPAGVTGPVARGEPGAVAAHVAALPAPAAELYAWLAARLWGLVFPGQALPTRES